MPESRLENLFNCYINNNLTVQEEEELMALLAQSENQVAVQKLIDQVIENTGAEMQLNDQLATAILQNILQKDKARVVQTKNRKNIFTFWMRVAAVAILFLGAASAYLIFNKKYDKAKEAKVKKESIAIMPGGNKALLTTSDGNTILLDSMQNGTFIQKGATKISKQGGLLIYTVSPSASTSAPIVYNTLSTPRGGQYQVVLPDGSNVWLNAASSLHFPSVFPGKLRVVELTGEAYFEVAKNKEKPFQVNVGEMKINVLGTHFNINAYADENALKTSLLEGSVNITTGTASAFLKPGQQASYDNENKVKITNADMDEVMAWKNGLFQFDGADIAAIMNQIGRWYDVDIVYAGKVPVRSFDGKISRDAQLSDVLKILELNNVKFTIDGRKIIVQ